MHYLKCLSWLLLELASVYVFADDSSIRGVVIDAETKQPLPFTNIVISGQGRGTVANAEGVYILALEGMAFEDSVVFSHVGYQTIRLSAHQLQHHPKVPMKPATVNLNQVAVYSKELTAEQIIDRVKKNYPSNYPEATHQQRIFLHKYEKSRFPQEDHIVMKKSDFAGFDKETFNELLEKLPDEFVEYQDALVDVFEFGEKEKLVPVEGITLEEASMQDLTKEIESLMSTFILDIEKTKANDDVYYKFRSGLFSFDADMNDDHSDSTNNELENHQDMNALHYTFDTDQVKSDLNNLIEDYADMESDNWSFITSTGKYRYRLEGLAVYNDEVVYEISFTPKWRGLFEGTMYVSTTTFAIIELDYAFASGKDTENFQLLGIGHSLDFKRARVLFERRGAGYYVKYIYAEQHEKASIERSFSFMKKEKRFFLDKTLNEMKFDVDFFFDISSSWELLVLNSHVIDAQDFARVEQPEKMKFRKEYAYSPEMWSNSTVIAPTSELEKYKRKE